MVKESFSAFTYPEIAAHKSQICYYYCLFISTFHTQVPHICCTPGPYRKYSTVDLLHDIACFSLRQLPSKKKFTCCLPTHKGRISNSLSHPIK